MVLITGYKRHLHHTGHPSFGLFTSPNNGQRADLEGLPWAMDNDAFSGRFSPDRFWRRLETASPDNCLFVAVPDVVADWDATLARFDEWAPRISSMGFPPAIVLQDGATVDTVPWDRINAVFVGGSTEWKLSDAVEPICREARRRGLWVHMGRVNSKKRMRWAHDIGCDSVDGTFSKFDPPRVAKMLRWASAMDAQGRLF